jgi:exosortase N
MIPGNFKSGMANISSFGDLLTHGSLVGNKSLLAVLLFILSYIAVITTFLPGYIIIDYTILSALILAFYVISPDRNKSFSSRYLVLTIIFIFFSVSGGLKTFYFLAAGFALLFAIESLLGNIGFLPLFLLAVISPTFRYFNNMLGFPVRLKLSEWTGSILQAAGMNAEVTGNVISLNGNAFSVDPACVGLKMIAVSILAGLAMIAFFRKQKKEFGLIPIIICLAGIVCLNILANLLRIVLLTVLNLPPENPYHDIIGVLCFIVYVIIPGWFIIKWVAEKVKQRSKKNTLKKPAPGTLLLLNSLLLISIIITGIAKFSGKTTYVSALPDINAEGYSKQVVNDGIIKLEKEDALIYIKPLPNFYGAEHNPMICWTGSGYSFNMIKKQVINGTEIYTGTLKKDNDLIYSAWWFDDGTCHTISQSEWRLKALNKENFYLVNVNSENEETLINEVKKVLSQSLIKPVQNNHQ